MTAHQYGTLKYVVNNVVTVSELGHYSMSTLGSLVQRGWVKRDGNKIEPTQDGMDAYYNYFKATSNYRKVDKEISERVRLMLHINKLVAIKTKAS